MLRLAGTSFLPLLSSTALVVSASLTETAAAQVQNDPGASGGILLGQVVDTAGAAMADAEVLVLAGDRLVGMATSNGQGNFRLRPAPSDSPYVLVARKFGYHPARIDEVRIRAGDTLRLRLELPVFVAVLDSITVEGRKRRAVKIATVATDSGDVLIIKFGPMELGVAHPLIGIVGVLSDVIKGIFGEGRSRDQVPKAPKPRTRQQIIDSVQHSLPECQPNMPAEQSCRRAIKNPTRAQHDSLLKLLRPRDTVTD